MFVAALGKQKINMKFQTLCEVFCTQRNWGVRSSICINERGQLAVVCMDRDDQDFQMLH